MRNFPSPQEHSHQFDSIWSVNASDTFDVLEHYLYPQSVMIWTGVFSSVKTPFVFLDQEEKCNQEVYRQKILKAVFLPWAHQHFGNANCTFQLDFVPANKAKMTRGLHGPDFSSQDTTRPGWARSKEKKSGLAQPETKYKILARTRPCQFFFQISARTVWF